MFLEDILVNIGLIQDIADIISEYHELIPELLHDYESRIEHPACAKCGLSRGCMYCGESDKYMCAFDDLFICCPNYKQECWKAFLTAPPSCGHCDKYGSGCDC